MSNTWRIWTVLVAVSVTVAACSTAPDTDDPPPPAYAQTRLPAEATTIVTGENASDLALATSRLLFRQAPAVVLVGSDDDGSFESAATAAVELGVPLLVAPPAGEPGGDVREEIDRLRPRSVVAIGPAATAWAHGSEAGPTPSPAAQPVLDSGAGLDLTVDQPLDQLLVLAQDTAASRAAVATARAGGARIMLLDDPDPRTSTEAISALSEQSVAHVVAIGDRFGSPALLRERLDTAATGVLLPGGGQVVFPYRRMVALYGHPGDPGLGSLGEQGVDAAIARAQRVAADYQRLVDEPVVPAFEIIATVASASAGADGDYSSESDLDHLRPWIEAAKANGVYVMLDLQPGRTDFLTQAKLYTEFLTEPHVGLALDPEWRLKPNQRHMVQIGSVSAAEINATAQWLADLTREHRLPQKVLMLHQFRLDMISDRGTLDTTHDELQVVIHADGFGTPGQKHETWRFLHLDEPDHVWWGWKNFYDEDRPTFSPVQTYAIDPAPVFVSYQ